MTGPSRRRFRWTTIIRAIEWIVATSTNAQMVAIIEEYGFGDDMDRRKSDDRTTPKLGTMLMSEIRRNPDRLDSDGELAAESIVRRAARVVRDPEPVRAWPSAGATPHQGELDLRASLLVDGWDVQQGKLMPVTLAPVAEKASRLQSRLSAKGYEDAGRRLSQIEAGLEEGHWESANSDIRAFLAALFTAIAHDRADPGSARLEEGEARRSLQQAGFFKPDTRKPSASLEADFVRSLFPLLGSEGAHAGLSDQSTALYRYGLAVLTAEYFLERHLSR